MATFNNTHDIESSLENALEDLTIQNVVLESMECESWPGIERERQEVIDKIRRLKDEVKRLRLEIRNKRHDDLRRSAHERSLSSPSNGTSDASYLDAYPTPIVVFTNTQSHTVMD
ncbi:hypothetical protein E4U42_006439 [Claviceps africana]|uniref:Uncharacterized protein n=1 Tax=Claviceps africana TaxID=83212 RepID=A0A8K0NGQ2_9HYPO|nr:hypothetical protein E4U42_006439 [Claviceps africana]